MGLWRWKEAQAAATGAQETAGSGRLLRQLQPAPKGKRSKTGGGEVPRASQ